MANYTKEISHMLDRFQTKLLMQDKEGFYKKDLNLKLSMVELLTLRRIGELREVRLNDLIALLEIDRNLVNTTLKRLMALKLIGKEQDEADGRGQKVFLQPAGDVAYQKLLNSQGSEMAFVLSDVTINEEKAILKFLSKMVQYHTEKYEPK